MDIIYFINGGLRFIFIFVRKPEGLHLGTSVPCHLLSIKREINRMWYICIETSQHISTFMYIYETWIRNILEIF